MASIGKVSPAAATFAAPVSQASQSIVSRFCAKIPFSCRSCPSLTTRNIAVLVTLTAVAAFVLSRLYGSFCATQAKAKAKIAKAEAEAEFATKLAAAKAFVENDINAEAEDAPAAEVVAANMENLLTVLERPVVAAKIAADSKSLADAKAVISGLRTANTNLAAHVDGVNNVFRQAKEVLAQV